MSWRDEDIDKLFQENAANASFEYKDEYWKKFEAAALPVNKGRKDFLWIGTALVFLGIISTMSVYNTNGYTENADTTNLVASVDKQNESNKLDNQSIETSNANNLATTNSKTANDSDVTDADVILEDDNQESRVVTNSTSSSSYVGNDPSSVLGTTRSNLSGDNDEIVATNRNSSTDVKLATGSDDIATDLSIPTIHSFRKEEGNSDVDSEAEVDFEFNSLLIRALNAEYDKLQAPEFNFKMPLLETRTAAMLYFELNGGLSESIVSPSDQYSNSFGAGVGVEIQKNRLNFTFGVNGIISTHKDIQLSRNTLLYGFGSEVIRTQLNYSEIYSIEGNLSIGVNLGKHVLSLGVRPSYAVGSKVRDRRVINNIVVHDIQGYGYMDGLKRFGLKPQIGYAYKFKRGFTLGANLGVQTREALNEEFVNGENNRFPLDGQVYFRKSIRLRR